MGLVGLVLGWLGWLVGWALPSQQPGYLVRRPFGTPQLLGTPHASLQPRLQYSSHAHQAKGSKQAQNTQTRMFGGIFGFLGESDLGVSNLKPTKHARVRQNTPCEWR